MPEQTEQTEQPEEKKMSMVNFYVANSSPINTEVEQGTTILDFINGLKECSEPIKRDMAVGSLAVHMNGNAVSYDTEITGEIVTIATGTKKTTAGI